MVGAEGLHLPLPGPQIARAAVHEHDRLPVALFDKGDVDAVDLGFLSAGGGLLHGCLPHVSWIREARLRWAAGVGNREFSPCR